MGSGGSLGLEYSTLRFRNYASGGNVQFDIGVTSVASFATSGINFYAADVTTTGKITAQNMRI